MEHLPHSYPFALLDRIVERCPGASATAEKTISHGEIWSPGDASSPSALPGILFVEMCAQVSGLVLEGDPPAGMALLCSVHDFTWQAGLRAGTRLLITATLEKQFGPMISTLCRVHDDHQTYAEGRLALRVVHGADGAATSAGTPTNIVCG